MELLSDVLLELWLEDELSDELSLLGELVDELWYAEVDDESDDPDELLLLLVSSASVELDELVDAVLSLDEDSVLAELSDDSLDSLLLLELLRVSLLDDVEDDSSTRGSNSIRPSDGRLP